MAVYLEAGNFSQGGWKAGAVREGFRKEGFLEQPSRPSTFHRPDRLVIVDEFRTTRVSSSMHARQPCELHLPDDRPRPAHWVPPAGQVNQRLLRPALSLQHAKDVRGLKWCHEVPPNPPPPPPAQALLAQEPAPPAQTPLAPPPAQDPHPHQPRPSPWPRPHLAQYHDPRPLHGAGGWTETPTLASTSSAMGRACSAPWSCAAMRASKEYQPGYKRVNDRLPKARQRLHRAAEYRRGIDGQARNNA
ncbi:hypothetical protein QJQ45_004912 [Haematococcus lacustris]|nr:hypothetical protein QJQ45_004912 [Haematococcus lacustris]